MPRPSIDASALAGYLTASITMFNVSDGALVATVSYLDPKAGPTPLGTYSVGPSEELRDAVPAGSYKLVFEGAAGASAQSCTLTVGDASEYTFVGSPGGVVVTRAGDMPASIADLFVAHSPLCTR